MSKIENVRHLAARADRPARQADTADAGPAAPARPPYLPAVLVLAAAALLLWAYGTGVTDMLRFALYEAGYVLLPGCVAYVALVQPAGFGVKELAVGWAFGYALEGAAFMITAGLGARTAFTFYPALVLVATVLFGRAALLPLAARARAAARASASNSWGWGAAAVAAIFLAYFGETFLTVMPLPGTVAALSWYPDVTWQISVAAETLHHWPVHVPDFAGEPLRYHLLSTVHMAAVSQVTGLPLYLVGLRLAIVPQLLLVVLGFVAAGQAVGRSRWGGVLGAGLIAVVGFVDPGPQIPGALLTNMWLSASWLLGLAVFMPLLAFLGEWLNAPVRLRAGGWVVLAGLLFAVGAAKATTLPVVGGGLGLVALYALARRRPYWVRAVAMAALTVLVFALEYKLMFSGGRDGLLVYEPLTTIRESQPLTVLHRLPLVLAIPLGVVAGALVCLKFFAGVIPGLAVAGRQAVLRTPAFGLVLATGAASFAPMLVYTQVGDSQLYFPYYGWAALAALSGVGVLILARGAGVASGLSRRAWIALACLAAGLWAVEGPLNATPKATWSALNGTPTYSTENSNLTPALFSGLRWIAEVTPKDAVFAIDTHTSDAAGTNPRWCYFTALAERRAWIGCAIAGTYTIYPGGQQRLAVNDAIFTGDRRALQRAVDAGVSFVAVDLVHGPPPSPNLARAGRQVFDNGALRVYDVRGLRLRSSQ